MGRRNLLLFTPAKLFTACLAMSLFAATATQAEPIVRFHIGSVSFDVELFENAAPITVANFLDYVRSGSYTKSLVHRSVQNFVVQGGGFTFGNTLEPVIDIPTNAPIQNEFGLANTRGTIAMAKQPGNPNSATNQWFINTVNNTTSLDNIDDLKLDGTFSDSNGGFAVFGKVIGNGMDIVDAIAALRTITFNADRQLQNGTVLSNFAFADFPVIDGTDGNGNPTTSALVVSSIEILETPEPGTLGILAISCVALLRRRPNLA